MNSTSSSIGFNRLFRAAAANRSNSEKFDLSEKSKSLSVNNALDGVGKNGLALRLVNDFIVSKKSDNPETSYTAFLSQVDIQEASRIFVDESVQFVLRIVSKSSKQDITDEAADVLYNLLILLQRSNVEISEVFDEIINRVVDSGINSNVFKKFQSNSLSEMELFRYLQAKDEGKKLTSAKSIKNELSSIGSSVNKKTKKAVAKVSKDAKKVAKVVAKKVSTGEKAAKKAVAKVSKDAKKVAKVVAKKVSTGEKAAKKAVAKVSKDAKKVAKVVAKKASTEKKAAKKAVAKVSKDAKKVAKVVAKKASTEKKAVAKTSKDAKKVAKVVAKKASTEKKAVAKTSKDAKKVAKVAVKKASAKKKVAKKAVAKVSSATSVKIIDILKNASSMNNNVNKSTIVNSVN